MRVLVIEDDPALSAYIKNGLKESGYVVDTCADGKEGLFLATTEAYDCIIADRLLPSLDGLSIIKTLRNTENTTPILILSAMGSVDDRVEGLKAGGDDYITKPFAFIELLARLESLIRRNQTRNNLGTETILKAGDLEMNLLSRKVIRNDTVIELQTREFSLLEYLLRHKDQLVTRTMLLEAVWDYHFDPQTNVIDVHISRLRKKIDFNFDKPLIKTVRGSGYILTNDHTISS